MEILETKIGYTCPIFRVEERLVKYTDAFSEINYVVVRQPGVQIIALNQDLKIVLIKQFRGKNNLEKVDLVGGKINKYEVNLPEAKLQASTELLEETGYKAQNIELLQMFDVSVNWFERKYFQFIAWDLEKVSITPVEGEEITLFEIDPQELVQLINSNIFEPHEEDALVKALQLFKQKNLI